LGAIASLRQTKWKIELLRNKLDLGSQEKSRVARGFKPNQREEEDRNARSEVIHVAFVWYSMDGTSSSVQRASIALKFDELQKLVPIYISEHTTSQSKLHARATGRYSWFRHNRPTSGSQCQQSTEPSQPSKEIFWQKLANLEQKGPMPARRIKTKTERRKWDATRKINPSENPK
jgi:hypothetical protein